MSRHLSAFNRLGMGSAIVFATVLLAIIFSKDLFYSGIFDLHGECYRWIPSLVALHVVSDTAIGLAYFIISSILFVSTRMLKLPFQTIFLAFGAFVICCGVTHFMEVITTIFTPIYWIAGFIKLITAIISVWTAIMLPPLIPKIRQVLANEQRVQEQNREIARLYKQYRALADAMPLLVWTGNARGEYEYFNTMWQTYTGYELEKLFEEVPKGIFIHPDDFQRENATWQRRRQLGLTYEAELRVKRNDGTFRWHLVHNLPMYGNNDTLTGWVSIAMDIDKQKRNEQALREAQQQDNFLTQVSHELKTPLTSIQLLISFFRREITDVKYERAISTIENQLQHIVRLVNDLFDMAKVKADKLSFAFVSRDMVKLAHDAVNRMQVISTTHKLIWFCDTTARVQADPDRLEQAIVNLLTNAIKYSPEADHVDIRITSNENTVLLSVQDYGIGISQEAQAHIFEQYYRSAEASHQKYPGLGVGLYITSEIIKRHYGQIWVESEQGKGSTFFLSLPLEREDKESEA